MKKISVIALALVASTVVLSGCGEKKIEPNNYYCTTPFDGGKYGAIEALKELARQGKIDNASDFLEQCKVKKLGSYGEELRNLRKKATDCMYQDFNLSPEEKAKNDKCRNAPKELIAKWKKESEAEQYLICLAKRQGNFKRSLFYE